jgi:16S rRNA (cytosine1402-N4)-methyltransferase
MRMDTSSGETAAEWLARVDVGELERVIRTLGEEKFARRIARAIDAARAEAPIDTTARLAAIVEHAVPRRERDRHPATRTFQAIRMAVNQELEALDAALEAVPDLLAPGGRLAVISFHSLEDRRVKRFIRSAAGERPAAVRDHRGRLPPVEAERPAARLRPVGKPVVPGDEEVQRNPRARSARLRIAECPA